MHGWRRAGPMFARIDAIRRPTNPTAAPAAIPSPVMHFISGHVLPDPLSAKTPFTPEGSEWS